MCAHVCLYGWKYDHLRGHRRFVVTVFPSLYTFIYTYCIYAFVCHLNTFLFTLHDFPLVTVYIHKQAYMYTIQTAAERVVVICSKSDKNTVTILLNKTRKKARVEYLPHTNYAFGFQNFGS